MSEPRRISAVEELTPELRRRVVLWLNACEAACEVLKIGPVIIETRRTLERQRWLWLSGRPGEPGGRPGPILTNALGDRSKHVAGPGEGLALDFMWSRPPGLSAQDYGAWVWSDQPPWALAGAIGEALGLVWGGRWRSFDLGHLELPR